MDIAKVKNNIKSIVNRYFIAIVIVGVLLILAGGYWFFVKNTVDKIRVVGIADLENKQLTIDQQQRALDKLKKLRDQYEALDYDQLKQMQAILPHEAELPYVVMKLKQVIIDNGLELDSIDSGSFTSVTSAAATPAPAIRKLNISVSFKGIESYGALKNFLDQLSNTVPFFELNALSYIPGASAYSLNLTTYYQ
ncbi:MAG: type 4a pilus biogenesis protein PilO [Patescibacteria group bacterium]|jgi:Tfp pilus assembly protein PilO